MQEWSTNALFKRKIHFDLKACRKMSDNNQTDANESLRNLEDIYQLAPMQQGMLFHSIYSPDSGTYFEQSLFTIKGDLNISAFEQAWQRVVERHSILRTSFLW